jgi:hypothetical protein
MSGDAAAAAAVEPEAKRRRKEVVESIPEALNAGRDPRVMTGKDDHVLNRAAESTLIGIMRTRRDAICWPSTSSSAASFPPASSATPKTRCCRGGTS